MALEQPTMDFMVANYEEFRAKVWEQDPVSVVIGELRAQLDMLNAHINGNNHMANYYEAQLEKNPLDQWSHAMLYAQKTEAEYLRKFREKLAQIEQDLRTALGC